MILISQSLQTRQSLERWYQDFPQIQVRENKKELFFVRFFILTSLSQGFTDPALGGTNLLMKDPGPDDSISLITTSLSKILPQVVTVGRGIIVAQFGPFQVRGRSQTTLTRFWLFLTTYPPPLTFSTL